MVIGVAVVSLFLIYALQRKLGLKGWEAFVPGYDLWIYFDLAFGNPKLIFLLLLLIIPLIGWLIVLVLLLVGNWKIAKKLAVAYNKKTFWVFLLWYVYLAPSVFRDAPNCDDVINQFVAKLFGIKSSTPSIEGTTESAAETK